MNRFLCKRVRTIVSFVMLMAYLSLYAQSALSLTHIGSVPKKECPVDLAGVRCARIIVEIPIDNVLFKGDIVKDLSGEEVVVRNGSYRFWVSVNGENQTIRLFFDNSPMREINLLCDGDKLVPGEAYKCVVPLSSEQKGSVVFKVDSFIDNCVIEINNQNVVVVDGTAKVSVPVGRYEYKAMANGYNSIAGFVDILANQVSTENISLGALSKRSRGYIKERTKTIFNAVGDYINGVVEFEGLPQYPFALATPGLKQLYKDYYYYCNQDFRIPRLQANLAMYIYKFVKIEIDTIEFIEDNVVEVKGFFIRDWSHYFGYSSSNEDHFSAFDIILKYVDNDWFLDNAIAGQDGSYMDEMKTRIEINKKYH